MQNNHFDHEFVAGLTDESIVSLFLHGSSELSKINDLLYSMTQTYISIVIDTNGPLRGGLRPNWDPSVLSMPEN